MLFSLAAMTLAQVWVTRVDSEFTDFDQVGDSLGFGTYSSFGVLGLEKGTRKWAFSIKDDQLGTKVALDDATFLVSIGNGPLSAYDANTGKRKWTLPHKGFSSPVLLWDGIAYAEIEPNRFAAIDAATHKTVWSVSPEPLVKTAEAQVSSKPIYREGTILVGLRTGNVVELDAKTGELKWRAALSDSPVQAILYDDERIYATSARGVLFGIGRETGTVVWRHDMQNAVAGSPLLQDGKLAVVSPGGFVTWLAAMNGAELWRGFFSKDQDFSATAPIPLGTGILFMRRSGAIWMDAVGHQRGLMTFPSAASARVPMPYKSDYILFDSHAVFRARPQ